VYILTTGNVLIGTATDDGRRLHAEVADAVTNAVTYVTRWTHTTSGTAAPGFGVGLDAELKSTTANRVAGALTLSWLVATDALRTTVGKLFADDHDGSREGIAWGANGTAATVGFYGVTPVVRQAGNIAAGLVNLGLFSSATLTGALVTTTRLVVGDSPYTVLATDEVIYADTDGGALTVNLPAGVDGAHYVVINCGSAANTVTLNPNGAEKICGEVSQTLYDGEVLDIHFETTDGWY